MATTYRPDHNGECLNCDEPLEVHQCPQAPAVLAPLNCPTQYVDESDKDYIKRVVARVLELEAETAKYDEMRQGYMDHMNAKVQELEAALATSQEIGDTFWEALKPLNLQAIYVQNPGLHVTELIERVQELEREVQKLHDDEMRTDRDRGHVRRPQTVLAIALADSIWRGSKQLWSRWCRWRRSRN